MRRLSLVLMIYLIGQLMSPESLIQARRTRHSHHRVLSSVTSPPSKYARCGESFPSICNCTTLGGSTWITCNASELTDIPRLEPSSSIVKTLNLNQNNITAIEIGTFFGIKVETLLLAHNDISDLDYLSLWGLEFNLEILDLSYNAFKHVPSSPLRLLRNLRTLKLDGNQLSSLQNFDFGYLRKLQILTLDNNPIVTIDPDSFHGTQLSLLSLNSISLRDGLRSFPSTKLKLLKGLSLANNNLESFPPGWFNNLKCLCYLSLANNNLKYFQAAEISGVGGALEALELNSNQLEAIPGGIPLFLPRLKTLELNDNLIWNIPENIFNTSSRLLALSLRNNLISKLSIHAFEGLPNIQKIDLRDNFVSTLDDRMLYWHDLRGREIMMANNPFLCNCQLKWLKREFKRRSDMSRMFTDAMSMICETPYYLEGVPVIRLHLKEFTCDHDYYYYYIEEDTEAENTDHMYDNEVEYQHY